METTGMETTAGRRWAIEEMAGAAGPAVVGNGGTVIKLEADNLYAMFPTPQLALEGALDIFRAFDAVNSVVPPERHHRRRLD